MSANTPKQNEPLAVPKRTITAKVTQDPVVLLEESVPTPAPDNAYEGIQINFHEGFMVQVIGEGTVVMYGRLREDLPWIAFDTVTVDPGFAGVLKQYWGVPLLAARVTAVATSIKVVVM